MTIKIIAATLTTQELELITEEGDTIVLPQGHPKVPELVNKVLPITARGDVAVIEKEFFENPNVFASFEKKTGGLVKFFRVAKSAISSLFSNKSEIAVDLVKQEKAVQEILQQTSQEPSEYFTTVAKVGDSYIPGMEKLSNHFHHSLSEMGSTIGIQKFLERIGSIIHERQHSIEDLLAFMEKADLPIADDGSIIIYKGLNKTSTSGIFVDAHTGKVTQKVGSLVYMDASSVDSNRARDCSQGLHVARKGYLRNFDTDLITLCKVNPEDVIAVPSYDANKMRVSAYHILFQLPPEDAEAVRNSREMKQSSLGSKMLSAAISGIHIGITSKVYIGGPRGTQLSLEGFTEQDAEEPLKLDEVKSISQVQDIDAKTAQTPPVDVMDTASKMKEIKKMTRSEEIRMLIEQHRSESDSRIRKGLLVNLLDLKRASKKSWEYHGVSKADAKRITELAKSL